MITVQSFTLPAIQQAFNTFASIIKKLYPLRQVASGYVNGDGTVFASVGLRAVDPVTKPGVGQYRVHLSREISFDQSTLIFVPLSPAQTAVRSVGANLLAATSDEVLCNISGQDAAADPIAGKDTGFYFVIYAYR